MALSAMTRSMADISGSTPKSRVRISMPMAKDRPGPPSLLGRTRLDRSDRGKCTVIAMRNTSAVNELDGGSTDSLNAIAATQ